MRYQPITPPRPFAVGDAGQVTLYDFGRLELAADEQLTFVTADGAELDVTRKEWGFYATPSTNKRLARFGLRAVLALNRHGHLFVLLCEVGHEAAFDAYVASEGLELLTWLDDDRAVAHLATAVRTRPKPARLAGELACPCAGRYLCARFSYSAPPAGETAFGFSPYAREYHECGLCGHMIAAHDLDLSALYSGSYVDATYGRERMRSTFERIISLPPEQSDNFHRVQRVNAYAAAQPLAGRTLLDVGAGLGVFPRAMRLAGWECTTIDPDPAATELCRELAGVNAVCGDFFAIEPDDLGSFDVVSLNKVIEHVADPVAMLARAKAFVAPLGFLYVEVPDVAAADESIEREEFFVEHVHVFSPASLARMAERAGVNVARVERLREPSGKYTLAAFLQS